MPTKVFVVAGEASGDAHLRSLLRELHERHGALEVRGLAGPLTQELAQEFQTQSKSSNDDKQAETAIDNWIDDAAVVGLSEVLQNYRWFKIKFNAALRELQDWQPDLLLLVDYPGFNLRLAKAARKLELPHKTAFYISPQVWAWNRRRIKQMGKYLDLMLCIFPFEKSLYEESGLPTSFVGHPLIDELRSLQQNPPEREENLVALLPGSRQREVERLFPLQLKAALELQENQARASTNSSTQKLRFMSAASSEKTAMLMRQLAAEHPELEVEITLGQARELMQRATCGVIASGTATLEAACLGLPYCLMYQVAWPTYLVGKLLIKVDYLGIVNVLSRRELVREFIQADARPTAIAAELQRLLEEPQEREKLQEEFAEIVHKLGQGGAATNAAQALTQLLASTA